MVRPVWCFRFDFAKDFDHNQEEFTKAIPETIPIIAVVEEAQSMLDRIRALLKEPFVTWVKEGRKYDLGAMLITQQPASIPHEILSQETIGLSFIFFPQVICRP